MFKYLVQKSDFIYSLDVFIKHLMPYDMFYLWAYLLTRFLSYMCICKVVIHIWLLVWLSLLYFPMIKFQSKGKITKEKSSFNNFTNVDDPL